MKNQKLLFILLFHFFLLSACYSNWEALDTFSKHIECDWTKDAIIQRAEKFKATTHWDQGTQLLSIKKESDAVAVQFSQYNQKIVTIAASKSKVVAMGLHRKQTQPFVVLACDNF